MSSTSDTSKRAEASRKNRARSLGPKTVDGKDRSRFNAMKHGMRARTAFLPGEDPAAFQARRDAWTARAPAPRRSRAVPGGAGRAGLLAARPRQPRPAARLDDRAAPPPPTAPPPRPTRSWPWPAASSGTRAARSPSTPSPPRPSSHPTRVSWSREIDDPNDPARLVNRLEDLLLGCAWMLDRWADLRNLLVNGMNWQAPSGSWRSG